MVPRSVFRSVLGLLLVPFVISAGSAVAQERHEQGQEQHHEQGHAQGHEGRAGEHAPAPHAEPHLAPRGYQGLTAPPGWNKRPENFNRGAYAHNYQAPHRYHVGPYQRPSGWRPEHWHYGEMLPRAYWVPEYILADYWLFGLDVPPPGYEWVRDDDDAILVNTATGEILQVDYGVFG